jgi:hypothetical protein
MDSSRLAGRNPLPIEPVGPDQGRSAWRKAVEITKQIRGTGSRQPGEGVSGIAEADTDTAGEVEPAGHFRRAVGDSHEGGRL